MLRQNISYLYICVIVATASCTTLPWSFFGSSTPEPATPTASPIICTIMIDPAGDARDTGREIDDTFERSLTLQSAQELKIELEKIAQTRIVLTRFAGDIIEPLQNAAFANRLNVDLYIRLQFYQTKEKTAPINTYYTLYNPHTDLWEKKSTQLTLLPFDQAYKRSVKKTKQMAQSFSDNLKKMASNYTSKSKEPLGLPLKALAGIDAPAVVIEIGLKTKDSWKALVPLLAAALEPLINECKEARNAI